MNWNGGIKIAYIMKENSEEFRQHVREAVLNLKPNKSVKFHTSEGVFKVAFNKKMGYFNIILDGYGIEEVADVEDAIESVLNFFNWRKDKL